MRIMPNRLANWHELVVAQESEPEPAASLESFA